MTNLACGGEPNKPKQPAKPVKSPKVVKSLIDKNAKLAFIFPAGAGAMRVNLGILEKMTSDLGINHLDNFIDVVGGVSSGALTGAILTYGDPPKNSLADVKHKLPEMLKDIFPHANRLAAILHKKHNVTLDELETIFKVLMDNLSKDSRLNIKDMFSNAAMVKPTLEKKIIENFFSMIDILPVANEMLKPDASKKRSKNLNDFIIALLGQTTLEDPKNSKLIAISSYKREPVFFAPKGFIQVLPGPYAEQSTPLHKALIASSAIPGFFKEPDDINFYQKDGSGPENLSPLQDGFFAKNVGFDPSALFYDIFTKKFPSDELLIIYVGNGAPINDAFRRRLKEKSNNGVMPNIAKNGKRVIFLPIDAYVKDDSDNSLFNISSFYHDSDLYRYMDNAVKAAVITENYKLALKMISELKK
jgi:hypothetical protein